MKGTTVAPVKKEESVFEVILTVIYALLIALLIRSLFFEPFNIPSGSMTPTLLTGDYVFVSKFSYGYSRYSFPLSPGFIHGRLFGSLPKRGDVAVFINPHTGEDYIKRIVGLPGDKIQVVHGILTINGEASKRERIGDYLEHEWDERYDRPVDVLRYHYIETMPDGVKHEILGEPTREPEDSLPQDNTEVFTVPDGMFFAMGDNRDNSADSRLDLGYVPLENLVGRADRRFISLEAGAHLWQFWRWPWTLRISRFFGPIP
ncbi:MAG TPA: signal peptidase I [Alphaproteobacteria bacterium]|nr:signal peptidase I [Alphaproteobacteria bacterium]